MIYFEHLPLDKDIMAALSELKIDYVFQPIFYPDGKRIYAYEALMRPAGRNVMELIEEYTKLDKLHVLEVATFWGATQAYFLRGYTEKLAVNSFPCECFSAEEARVFVDYFGDEQNKMIIEMLEYPRFDLSMSLAKKQVAAIGDSQIALDDYGTGINDMTMVNELGPNIIKIDRSLLSGIDINSQKQQNCKEIIEKMHKLGILVIAEGVETKEEFDYLVNLGADLFQGYYLAKPA